MTSSPKPSALWRTAATRIGAIRVAIRPACPKAVNRSPNGGGGNWSKASQQDLLGDFSQEWVSYLSLSLQVSAFIEHGLWFALATAARDCLSDTVATCVCLQAAHKQRSAQAIVLYAMDLEPLLGVELPIEPARAAFLHDGAWQPARRYLERLAATADWGEVLVAANLCFEPTVATLIRRELGTRAATAHGDTVTPVLARAETQEWEWTRRWMAGLTRFLLADALHGPENRATITGWVRDWLPDPLAAAAALAPVGETVGVDAARAAERIRGECAVTLEAPPAARSPRRAVAQSPRTASTNGTYDYVGIVMAKSAEGDAVARCLAGHGGIEVLEQASFWDIRSATGWSSTMTRSHRRSATRSTPTRSSTRCRRTTGGWWPPTTRSCCPRIRPRRWSTC
jgi:hypothetical protein